MHCRWAGAAVQLVLVRLVQSCEKLVGGKYSLISFIQTITFTRVVLPICVRSGALTVLRVLTELAHSDRSAHSVLVALIALILYVADAC